MRGGGNSTVSLMPDWTVLVQMGIFFLVFIILKTFLFKPAMKLFYRRRQLLDSAGAEAVEMMKEAGALEAERRTLIEDAMAAARKASARKVEAAKLASERAVLSARKESALLLASAEEMCRQRKEDALKAVAARASELSRDIVFKLTEG